MSEVNRVFTHIDGFFGGGGHEHSDVLAEVLRECVKAAERGYCERDMVDEAVKQQIEDASDAAKLLKAKPPTDPEARRLKFREVAEQAMLARRCVLPLVHECPWKTVDPKEALYDNEDQYSFAIYDTLGDEIASLLPELHQIACEASWEEEESDDA